MNKNPRSPLDSEGRNPDGTFKPGTGGRLRGVRNKATELAERLFCEDVENVARAVTDRARGGDMTAARIVLERILPPRKDNLIDIDLPEITNAQDAALALCKVSEAMARGQITPEEARSAGAVIKTVSQAIEIADLERRIIALEGATK